MRDIFAPFVKAQHSSKFNMSSNVTGFY
eukprot:SAG31_NODE_21526_length_547_cov_0.919643_1_plen_27_part_10